MTEALANGTNFTACDLTEAAMTRSNFNGSTFKSCELVRAQLATANFEGADFDDTDLSRAHIEGATFTHYGKPTTIAMTLQTRVDAGDLVPLNVFGRTSSFGFDVDTVVRQRFFYEEMTYITANLFDTSAAIVKAGNTWEEVLTVVLEGARRQLPRHYGRKDYIVKLEDIKGDLRQLILSRVIRPSHTPFDKRPAVSVGIRTATRPKWPCSY